MTDSLYKIWGSTLTGTANAIRTKKGTSGDIDPANFESEILSIPSGGGSNLGTLNATSNGTYTPISPLDGWNEVNVSVSGGISATSIDIITELPSTLIEGAVYLIPNGEQIVPPLPLSIDTEMNRWAVTCDLESSTARTFPYSLTKAQIKSATKFYCYGAKVGITAEPQSFVAVPSTRGSYPSTMTFTDGNSQVMPTYIYKYEPATDTDWVDITSTITQSDWENNVVDHNMLDCFYSTHSMIRRSLNHIAYETEWNAIDTSGRFIKQGDVDEYNVYFVESGVATDLGSHNLKWVDEHFQGVNTVEAISINENGTYIPTTGIDGYNKINVEVPPLVKNIVECRYDFTSSTPYYDFVRDMSISSRSGYTHTEGVGLTCSDDSAYYPTYYALSFADCYMIELELGNYSLSLSNNSGCIINFSMSNPTNEQASICWRRDVQRWSVYTPSGWVDASSTYTENYFRNNKMIILYNCKYDNGQIVKYSNDPNYDYHWFNFYDKDFNPLITNYESNASLANSIIGLGGEGGYSCNGMIYKSLKVYKLNLDLDPSEEVIRPLNIYCNGTFEANGSTVMGYSPINVKVEGGLNGGIVSHYDFKNEQNLNDTIRDGMSAVENNSSYFSMISSKGLNITNKEGQLDCNLSILLYEGERVDIKIKFGEELPDFSLSRLISFKSANGDEHTLGWNDGSYWIWYSDGGNLYNTGVTNYDIFENSELNIQVKCVGNKLNFTYILPDGTTVDANLQQANGANVYLGQLSYSANGFRNLIVEDIQTTYKTYNSKDVKFYDYDGTVVYEYYPSEFMSLSSMPSQPTHTGMTPDGWNWTLSDAKSYVQNHGKIDIGATYTWSSSSTEIDIRLDNGRLSPYLVLGIDGTVTIDWGDSSATESITGSNTNTFIRTQHVYPQAGEYTIIITPDTGTTYHVGNGNNKLLMKNASGNLNSEDYVYVHSVINIRLGEGIIIGGECFRTYRNLKSILFHDVPTLTSNCFRDCDALEYLCLPNNTTTITQNAFHNDCALKIIILPKEITTVNSEAFRYSFAEIVCMNNKDVAYGSDSFANMRTLNHIYIPDEQTSLSTEMFRECFSLEEIIFSNALTTINSACFNYCYSINELNFPSSLDVINDTDAFGRCYGLSKVTFNKATMSKLGKNAFIYCNGLKEVNNLPEVTTYGIDIFRECYGIKELTPDSHMTSIPDGFVRGTALEEFVIPSGVTSIGNYSFYNIDTLASVTIPNGVTSIGEYCFNGLNSLVELNIPETVTDILRDAFENCNGLKKINLPSQLTVLNYDLFKNCHALTEITIPSGVTQIQGECFRYCYGLASIKFGSVNPPTLNSSNCFGGLPTDCIIYVPTGSLSDYTSAQYYPNSSTYTYVEY